MNDIENFIDFLSTQEIDKLGTSENLYFGKSNESIVRCWNLKIYLEIMKKIKPEILLLGEAPGYKGCRLTGVPFTSERILSTNTFFCNHNFKFINEKNKLESEQSATIIWNELNIIENKPLIWNIYPYHPFGEKGIKSNRTPNENELILGKMILEKILDLFNVKKIIAVGRKPESKLKGMNIDYVYVRHPANGGKKDFVNGLKIGLT